MRCPSAVPAAATSCRPKRPSASSAASTGTWPTSPPSASWTSWWNWPAAPPTKPGPTSEPHPDAVTIEPAGRVRRRPDRHRLHGRADHHLPGGPRRRRGKARRRLDGHGAELAATTSKPRKTCPRKSRGWWATTRSPPRLPVAPPGRGLTAACSSSAGGSSRPWRTPVSPRCCPTRSSPRQPTTRSALRPRVAPSARRQAGQPHQRGAGLPAHLHPAGPDRGGQAQPLPRLPRPRRLRSRPGVPARRYRGHRESIPPLGAKPADEVLDATVRRRPGPAVPRRRRPDRTRFTGRRGAHAARLGLGRRPGHCPPGRRRPGR